MTASGSTEIHVMSQTSSDPRFTAFAPRLAGTDAEVATLERIPSSLIIRVRGPVLGTVEAKELTKLAGPAVEVAPGQLSRVVIDLSTVTAISSTGLGCCLDLRRRADARGAETILLGLNEHLRSLVSTMRLERLFTLVDSGERLARRLAGAA